MSKQKEVLINLLPLDQERIAHQKLIIGFLVITVILLTILAVAGSQQKSRLLDLQNEQTKLRTQVIDYKKREAVQKQIVSVQQQLKQRRADITQAKQSGIDTSIILLEIEKSVPEQIMVIEVEFNKDKLVLNGFAPDQHEIAVLLSGLRKNSRFSNVKITATKLIEETEEIQFVIETEWREAK